MLDIGYFVPEVLIPVVCVLIGVLALGPAIIGCFYTSVSCAERGLLVLSAVLLMTPVVFFTAIADLTGVAFPLHDGRPPFLGPALLGVGLVLFLVFTVRSRRDTEERPASERRVETATDN